jgi:hypothetical protein
MPQGQMAQAQRGGIIPLSAPRRRGLHIVRDDF